MKNVNLSACVLFTLTASSFAQGLLRQDSGNQAGDWYGEAVASAGDVDGDGFADQIIGSPSGYVGGISKGFVRVRSGKTGALLHSLSGTVQYGGFGFDVAGLGDVNNDGRSDFALSIRPYQDSAGVVRVVSGLTGLTLYSEIGSSSGDWFGHSIASAGDVDKDGVQDLIIGAPQDSINGLNAGRAVVISGKTGATLLNLLGSAHTRFGYSVTGIGDVNGDGQSDLAVGVRSDSGPQGGTTGGVRVFSGKTGAQLWANFGSSFSAYGTSVAAAGDVNGDGIPDVLASGNSLTPGVFDAFVRVLNGATGAVLHQIVGETASYDYSLPLAGLGDLDDDGKADFAVGYPMLANAAGTPGGVRVFSGATASILYTLFGTQEGDAFGLSLANAGDANADGEFDLLIGAPRAPADTYVGATYLHSGVCGSLGSYGQGCAGSGGFVPTLKLDGCACAGGVLGLSLTKGYGGKPAMVLISPTQSAVPLSGGCFAHAFPFTTIVTFTQQGVGPGNGTLATLGLLPMNAQHVQFALQVIAIDPGVARGYSATKGSLISVE